jgi:hypothetical protein
MLMGRKPDYLTGFRPINIPCARKGDEGDEPVTFSAEASRPGRLVAATACPGRNSDGRQGREARDPGSGPERAT